MDTRNENLLNIRPQILSAQIQKNTSNDERFQNQTIRPIIKLQHNLLLEVFKNYINKHKQVFYELSLERRVDYIDNALHKDMKFRNSLKGMIIGQFTVDEYKLYAQNSSDLNKRIMNIIKDYFLDNIQLFQKDTVLNAV